MKKFSLSLSMLLFLFSARSFAQYSGSFVVQGDLGKYYPVIIQDLAWSNNKATEFEIGRSNIHTDATWRGSVIAKFRVHTTDYGHGSNFIDANIRQFDPDNGRNFIAGWADGTSSNGNQEVIVWLQGGSTTYYFNSPVNISPVVYDGVQHALPYQETNGPARTYKTAIDPYVNSNGESSGGTAFFTGGSNNYFAGKVGIGTTAPDAALTVNGTLHSKEVKVDMNVFPDYVFTPTYDLPSLKTVNAYVNQYHHLPDVPSARQVAKEGLNLGKMNAVLLKKVEELTLYLIEKDKQVKKQAEQLAVQNKKMDDQQKINASLQEQINRLARAKK
jgi:hypothetical protein